MRGSEASGGIRRKPFDADLGDRRERVRKGGQMVPPAGAANSDRDGMPSRMIGAAE